MGHSMQRKAVRSRNFCLLTSVLCYLILGCWIKGILSNL
ncbi:hypothetical protein D1BOALGB6SA_4957 [Olavius sp. associated proteobacterium Delta 1]|nr:hypothetical protein D1BOALGB6SA_4957 [Olavius sp. associated proteobacterium Delta 1]